MDATLFHCISVFLSVPLLYNSMATDKYDQFLCVTVSVILSVSNATVAFFNRSSRNMTHIFGAPQGRTD